MTSDLDIIETVRIHAPVERLRIAKELGIEADEEFSRALARLVAEKRLYRVAVPAPGRHTNFVYTLTDAGRAELAAPEPSPEAAPPADTVKEAPMSDPKQKPPTRRERILAIVRNVPDVKATAIAQQLGEEVHSVNTDLSALKAKGLVVQTGEKRPYGFRMATEAELPKLTYPKPAREKKPRNAKRPARTPRTAAIPPAAPAPNAFRVALTSNRTLLMQRPATHEEVELQPHEIQVLTGFLRDIDNVAQMLG